MFVEVLKSKIHRARVTASSLEYEGSITIDRALMDAVGFHPYEKVLVADLATGHRFETYIIVGKENSRDIILNGATARLGTVGDLLTIMSFLHIAPEHAASHEPQTATLLKGNKLPS